MVLVSGLVSITLLIPSVLYLPDSVVRTKFLLQLLTNLVVLTSVLGLSLKVSQRHFRVIIATAAVVVLFAAVLQLALEPDLVAGQGDRILGIPRPYGLFNETAWMATYLAMLTAAALLLGQRRFAIAMAVVVLVLFTRGAVVIAACALLGSVPAMQRSIWAQRMVVGAVTSLGFWFGWVAMTGSKPLNPSSTLDSRAAESWVIRAANGFEFWPLGGEVLDYRFYYYWAPTPDTSNVAILEFAWKFGIPGLILFAMFWFTTAQTIRKVVTRHATPVPQATTVWLALAAIPPTMQFNNTFGRPWFWAALALMVAVTQLRHEFASRQDERNTRPSQVPSTSEV